MAKMPGDKKRERNRAFAATHGAILDAAVRLIAEKGVEALSMASLARATGLNRTTLYYHFDGREALLDAVHKWSAEQLASAFKPDRPQTERIDYITGFILENPQLMKMWIDDFIAPGDIRDSYPHWDDLVGSMRRTMEAAGQSDVDVEVYCTMLITSAMIAPRVFKSSVCPDADDASVIERFRRERQRGLRRDMLLRDDAPSGGEPGGE